MSFCVQYNPETGEINATVGLNVPVCDNQLVFENWQQTSGMMVDVVNLILIPMPAKEGESQ